MKNLIILFLICVLAGCSGMSETVLDKAEITQEPIQTEVVDLSYQNEEIEEEFEQEKEVEEEQEEIEEITYIGNLNSYKFHYPSCMSVNQMNETNKCPLTCTRDEAISQGYEPCGRCNP